MKSRKMRWVGHVVQMEGRKGAHKVLVWTLQAKGTRSEREGNNKGIFKKWNGGRAWTGLVWLRLETGGQLLLMW
jgi:hypothetical protein